MKFKILKASVRAYQRNLNTHKSYREFRKVRAIQRDVYGKLNSLELNIAEELIILEIALRIIAADGIEHDLEKDFIKSLRKHLLIEDDIIFGRFGRIEYLSDTLGNSKTLDDKLGNKF